MKRINILYGGQHYSIGNRPVEEVLAEIEAGVAAPGPTWMTVNHGEGQVRVAHILLTPGVDIAVIAIDAD